MSALGKSLLISTADGSLTLGDLETGELYHNQAGAYTEALRNYCLPSHAVTKVKERGQLSILDVCFGLGYNTWVLLQELLQHTYSSFSVSVLGIECDPNMSTFWPEILKDPRLNDLKNKIGPLEHNIYYQTLERRSVFSPSLTEKQKISLEVQWGDLRKEIPKMKVPRWENETIGFDLIFHDAFSPAKVPELWTVELFCEYYRLLLPKQGKLLTYSSAGAVRGGLKEAGFHLYRTEAVGQKSGGTLASTIPLDFSQEIQSVFPLTEDELLFIQSRSGIPYRDLTYSDPRVEILKRRLLEQQDSSRPQGKRLHF